MKLSTVISGFVVSTLTLFCFATAVLFGGLTRRAAWLFAAGGGLCLSSGYRLWRRLSAVQSALRARLCREAPAPASTAREPLAQLVQHLRVTSRGSEDTDPFAAYQSRLGQGLFDAG